MKRLLLSLLVVLTLSIIVVSPVSASGNKVRGENGLGNVNQVQVMDPSPFQP